MGLNATNYVLQMKGDKSIASGFDHAARTGDNTFSIFFIDGSKVDLTIPLPKDGKDAVDITDVKDLGNGKFTLVLSDGSETSAVQTIKGNPGEAGTNGKSAYELAKDNGFIGTEAEWLESLKAEDGFSPTATVVKDGNKSTLTVTDKNGTTTVDILDGEGTGTSIIEDTATTETDKTWSANKITEYVNVQIGGALNGSY